MSRAAAVGNCESFTVTETTASPALDMTSVVDATTGGTGAETTKASNMGSMLHMLLQWLDSATAARKIKWLDSATAARKIKQETKRSGEVMSFLLIS
jgi:hypothetical protein